MQKKKMKVQLSLSLFAPKAPPQQRALGQTEVRESELSPQGAGA